MTDAIYNLIWEKCVSSANWTNTTHVMMYQKSQILPWKLSFWYFINIFSSTLEFKQWGHYPENIIMNETIQLNKPTQY